MREHAALPALVVEKLAAFERIEPAFEASFALAQQVQGERRFASFSVAQTVAYLHALYVCDCKDRLLSVPRRVDRFEGRHCLELLLRWQEGESADVVAFLQRKLDALPFAAFTRQLEAARRDPAQRALAERLAHGRLILLNRGMNLHQALDPLFTLPEAELGEQVRAACAHHGHTPEQIAEQLRELGGELYAYLRHPALAQRNMRLMDRMGVSNTSGAGDRPGERSQRVARVTLPAGPYAEEVIGGYVALTAPWHNNPAGVRFVDRPAPITPAPNVVPDSEPEAPEVGPSL